MSKDCFTCLCNMIERNIGKWDFKSEAFLKEMQRKSCYFNVSTIDTHKYSQMMNAHSKSTGGFISGEIKLAVTLRALAGGLHLDLALLFGVGFHCQHDVFHTVIKDWICNDRLVTISGEQHLNNIQRMRDNAREFATKTHGVFGGIIGALDSWLVRIKKPNLMKDGLTNVD